MAMRRGKDLRRPSIGANEPPTKLLQSIDRSLLSWVLRELHHKTQPNNASPRPTESQQRRVISPTKILGQVMKRLLSLKSVRAIYFQKAKTPVSSANNPMFNPHNSPFVFIALFWAIIHYTPSHIRSLLFQTLSGALFNRHIILDLPPLVIIVCSIVILAFCLFLNLDMARGLDANTFRRRPKFFLTHTSHRRFFPVHHHFSWPILYVGIPANFKGNVGRLFSVKDAKNGGDIKSKWSVFSLDPKHYTNPDLPWEEKFSHKLREAGHDPSIFSDMYIVTTPKFLGYSFNPVSYFLYYLPSGKLGAVVLEVKNTFKERHAYVISHEHAAEWNAANAEVAAKKWKIKRQSGFTMADRHPKEFHISPFNHRSGVYEFQVLDPSTKDRVHVHISVIDATGKKMMTASVKSTEQGIDMFTMKRKTALYMIFMWGATQFMAIPRTFYEALRLFRKRSMRVHQRPEVLPSSGARPETGIERYSRIKFLQYLKAMTFASPTPLRFSIYLPKSDPVAENRQITFSSHHFTSMSDIEEYNSVSLVVRSSAFFSRQFALENQRLVYLADFGMQLEERRTAYATEEDWKIIIRLVDNASGIVELKLQGDSEWWYNILDATLRPIMRILFLATRFARRFYTWTEGYPPIQTRRNGMDIYFGHDIGYKMLVAMVAKDSLFWWVWSASMAGLTRCGIDMSWAT